MLQEVNTPTWDKHLENKWVLVDFWAPWCQPCKQQQPMLEILSEELKNIEFLKLNIDDNRYLSQQLSVRNIPTLILYHNKTEIHRYIGLQSKSQLSNSLQNILNKSGDI
jgi:thioredoxin 1